MLVSLYCLGLATAVAGLEEMVNTGEDSSGEILHYPVSSGRYTVKEEIQKAPGENHFCNLTRTSVKISFPAMKSEIFVNFLGYKEPNLIHLARCKGMCGEKDSGLSCVPTRVKEKKVKMTVKSFLAESKPEEKLKEMVLEEHLECGCECNKELASQCAGRFNPGTCDCECGMREFGYAKRLCGMKRDMYWDYETCQCNSKNVVPREVDSQLGCDFYPVSARRGYRTIDIAGWVLLGSCLALVVILALATWHYRKKLRQVQGKGRRPRERQKDQKSKPLFADANKYLRRSEKVSKPRKASNSDYLDRIAIENSLLLSGAGGGQLYHEQYDEHGVKIEHQCFT